MGKSNQPVPAESKEKYPFPKQACSKKDFSRTVERHKMTVIRDDGLYRHLLFREPKHFNRWFELLTWPGRLCITGDAGTFVFTRLADMFEFFRGDSQIDFHYWAEKCEARDRAGVREFNAEKFKAQVWRLVTEYEESARFSEATRAEVKAEVIEHAYDGEYAAMTAAINFVATDGFRLHNFWEMDCKEYTYTFLWCCYAIAWGIRQYDAASVTKTKKEDK